MMEEVWKDIIGYEGKYMVSNTGNVVSISFHRSKKSKLLQPAINKGYYYISLAKEGIRIKHKIHRLVAQAFIENKENKPCINHKNGIKTDNRVENLEWCTVKENTIHSYKNKLQLGKPGELNGASKLTQKDVDEIRNKYSTGNYFQRELGKEYKVTQACIYCIINNKSWKNEN